MNQILLVKNEDVEKQRNNFFTKKRFLFRIQFLISILLLASLIVFTIYVTKINSMNSDDYASKLANNYQVYRLYANDDQRNMLRLYS